MAFTPKAALTHFKQTPTLEQVNGTFSAGFTKQRAWAIRLKMQDDQRNSLVSEARRDRIVDQPPSAEKLDSLRNRISLVVQRGLGRVPNGWSTRLNRPDPTGSGGMIIPSQLHVTQERIAFPGTEKELDARVTILYETELGEDNKTLSKAKKIGKVIAYELGDAFMLWRKMEAQQGGDQRSPLNLASDPNQGRTLIINAHGAEPSGEFKKIQPPMPLPDDMTLSYGVPSGYKSKTTMRDGDSEIGMLAEKRPRFASVRKFGETEEAVTFSPGSRLVESTVDADGRHLQIPAEQARDLFRLATGTSRAGHVSDSLMEKLGGVRNAPDRSTDGKKLPPIVDTRIGDPYDRVAFAAFNDRKVDILTVRSGKQPKKSDLIKVMDELGIRSQYAHLYDPSCRTPIPLRSEQTIPRWDPLADNIASDSDTPVLIKRTMVRKNTYDDTVNGIAGATGNSDRRVKPGNK